MGMELIYRRLTEADLSALEADPERALSYLFSLPGLDVAAMSEFLADPAALQAKASEIMAALENAQADPTRVDLNKDWHALHFLLTGDASLDPQHHPDDSLYNVVMGGRPTSLEGSYGPVRKFDLDDIQKIDETLKTLSIEELRTRFSADAFNAADIYPRPSPGGWDIQEMEGVFEVFPKLQQLFRDALKFREVVIVYMA